MRGEVAAVLGVEERVIGDEAPLMELGVDSLLAVEVRNALRKAFELEALSATVVFDYRTVRGIGEFILSQLKQSQTSEIPTLRNSSRHVRPLTQPIPVFLFHPIGGGVDCYSDIVQSISNRATIIGIECPMLKSIDNVVDKTTLIDFAISYIKDIKSIQNSGPYFLGGWSLGGMIAYEIAHHLSCNGEAIGPVCIIDAFNFQEYPQNKRIRPDNFRVLLNFASDYGLLIGLPDAELKALLNEKNEEKLIGWLKEKGLTSKFRAFQFLSKLIFDYVPSTEFKGSVTLIKASDSSFFIKRFKLMEDEIKERHIDESLGWSFLVSSSRLQVVDLPGDHYSIIKQPNAAIIADFMIENLKKSEIGMR